MNAQAQEDVMSGFVWQGGSTACYTKQDFLNILSFPPTQGHPQQLSKFECQFANSSIYEQVSLMFSHFDQEILRISLLRRQCATQEEFLKGKRCSVSASRAWCYTFKGLQTAIFWCSLVDSEIIHIFIHTLYLFHFDCMRL